MALTHSSSDLGAALVRRASAAAKKHIATTPQGSEIAPPKRVRPPIPQIPPVLDWEQHRLEVRHLYRDILRNAAKYPR